MTRHGAATRPFVPLALALVASVLRDPAAAFAPPASHPRRPCPRGDVRALGVVGESGAGAAGGASPAPPPPAPSVDVRDLGLTLDDLSKPIPRELLGEDFEVVARGVQSTSRIASVDDGGCAWEESSELVGATLRIPGLRGQPAAALAVDFATTTCTVTAFGRAVWSCVLPGECRPDSALTRIEEGDDMVPVIKVSVAKGGGDAAGGPAPRWGGFVDSIGEDSIL